MTQRNIFLIFLAAIFLGACATAPVTTHQSKPQEVILHIDSNQPIERINLNESDPDSIQRSMAIENEGPKLTSMTFRTENKAYMTLWSGLSAVDQQRMWNDFTVLRDTTNIREVDVYISSGGGSAFDGLGLADQIERAIRSGFKVNAHASGIIASAAVPIFAVCSYRCAAPGTVFMVHEAALWKWPGRETASDIRSQNDLMELLEDRYMAKMTAHSKLSKEAWEELERKTTWFSVEKAMEYGLVDKIE